MVSSRQNQPWVWEDDLYTAVTLVTLPLNHLDMSICCIDLPVCVFCLIKS